MNPKELRGLYEAYSEVYAPREEEIDEAVKGESSERRMDLAGERKAGHRPLSKKEGERYASHKLSQMAYVQRKRMGEELEIDEAMSSYEKNRQRAAQRAAARNAARDSGQTGNVPGVGYVSPRREKETWTDEGGKERHKTGARMPQKEEFDVFDVVLEFLQAEGYAETLEEAEWLMANVIDEEAIGIILGEAITSEKGKAKAAQMIAARSTPSGRAKAGQGANVDLIKHIGRANVDKYMGTPPNRKIAKNPVRSNFSGLPAPGSGNKAARRAGTYQEQFELWVNSLVEEGYNLSGYTWDEMYEIYLDEAQEARNNPEKYEAGEKKKYAPVRGERRPMPPRGNKDREAFEKWYAANVKEETLVEVDKKVETKEKTIDVMRGKNKVMVSPQLGTQKEEVEAWVGELVEEGYDLSQFTWDEMSEIYESVDLNEGSYEMPAAGDAERVSVTNPQVASKKRTAAQAQIRADMARIQLQKASAATTKESFDSIVDYLASRPDAFQNLEEGVFDPKKSKMRSASERSQRSMTDAQRKAAKKESERVAAIHSKGETALAGMRTQGKKGKVQTTPTPKSQAPAANRQVKGRYDKLAAAANKVLKDINR